MKKTSAFAVLLLATLAVQQLATAVPVEASGIRCYGVLNDLSRCLDFLQGDEDNPSDMCCDGVKTIFAAADTTEARRATCECLKSAYNLLDADLYAVQTLPGDCGVPLSYNMSPDTNCSEIE